LGDRDFANGSEPVRKRVGAGRRIGVSAIDLGSRPVARWVTRRSMLGPSAFDVDSERDRNWVGAGRAMGGSATQVAATLARLIHAASVAGRFRGRRLTPVASVSARDGERTDRQESLIRVRRLNGDVTRPALRAARAGAERPMPAPPNHETSDEAVGTPHDARRQRNHVGPSRSPSWRLTSLCPLNACSSRTRSLPRSSATGHFALRRAATIAPRKYR
jgi:hypothetical protein